MRGGWNGWGWCSGEDDKILILYRTMTIRCAVSDILARNTELCKELSGLWRGAQGENF